MQAYDFNLRSGSFLDSDHKLHDKFIKGGQQADYNKLVQLRVRMQDQMTILRRYYSSKSEKIKAAIIAGDIILQREKVVTFE